MQFRTPINISPSSWRISHDKSGFALGSCFSENMSERLARLKYEVACNPFGPIYNPQAMCHAIERIAEGREFCADDLCEWGGRWFSTEAHTLLAADSPDEALSRLNSALRVAHDSLAKADYVILTLGTNCVYELNGRVVANCHRLPAARFTRRGMSVGEVVDMLSQVVKIQLAGKQIVLTVSPIRHLKDGLSENSLSKATLRVAAAEMTARYPQSVSYFPAYEILMDDLRDYRFYAADMAHPSEQAVEYVWQKFSEAWIESSEAELNKRIERLVRACAHRPLDVNSGDYQNFLEHTLEECRVLATQHSEIDFDTEIDFLNRSLIKK